MQVVGKVSSNEADVMPMEQFLLLCLDKARETYIRFQGTTEPNWELLSDKEKIQQIGHEIAKLEPGIIILPDKNIA